MQIGRQNRYSYGIWEADLLQQLFWVRLGLVLTDGLANVPSWSWASKLGPRDFWPFDEEDHLGIESQAISVGEAGVMTMRNTFLRKYRIAHLALHQEYKDHLQPVEAVYGDFLDSFRIPATRLRGSSLRILFLKQPVVWRPQTPKTENLVPLCIACLSRRRRSAPSTRGYTKE
jgi:hypothetical protein